MEKDRARFWSKVNVRGAAECWPWKAGRFSTGYGAFVFRGKVRHAPRVAFEFATGIDPGNALVRHRCDNPLCCNPAHLELGSHSDNMRDMAERGRAAQGDAHWTRQRPANLARGSRVKTAKLTEEQVAKIKLALAGGARQADLAKQYGVTRQLVWQIAKGKWWAHVQARKKEPVDE